jgi:predicted house-cleaning noncanonical NTP pyrophosphatase (MazG superfamily)
MYCPCLDKGHCKIDNAVVTNIEICRDPFDQCPLKTRYSDSLRAENKGLRRLVVEQKAWLDNAGDTIKQRIAERDTLRAENAQLIEALDKIHTRAVIKPDGDLLAQIAVIAEHALNRRPMLPKLVRDKCPTLFPKNVYRVATTEEMPCLLRDKLIEEMHEYLASGEIEELADLCEVINGVLAFNNWDKGEVLDVGLSKHARKGGFTKGIVLIEIAELEGDK